MLGIIRGIVNSFPGFVGENSYIMGMIAGRLADSLVPATLGLPIALAFCCYEYLLAELSAFDAEMECAFLELVNELRPMNV
jgi:hypothetical protein